MRKELIAVGAVSIALGVMGGACTILGSETATQESRSGIWEEVPDEEVHTAVKEEGTAEDIPEPEDVTECKTDNLAKERWSHREVTELTLEDAQLLMKIAQAEAGNQGIEGMRLVMSVVLNRVNDSDYPDTIKDVIYQPHQFSSVTDGNFENSVIYTSEAHQALAYIEMGEVEPYIIGFEVTSSKELDKYFDAVFCYMDHRFYIEK